MRLLSLSLLVIGLAACDSATPVDLDFQPTQFWQDEIETSARAVISHDDGIAALALTLSLHNKSRRQINFMVNAVHQLSVHMSSVDSPDSSYVLGTSVLKLPKLVYLRPGKVEVLDRSIRISELHQLGIPPGRYQVHVRPTTEFHTPQVAAGEVEVPDYTELPE